MPSVRRLRVSNPPRRRRSRNSRPRRRKNIAEVLIVPNPKRHRRSRRNRSHSRSRRRMNPFGKRRMSFRRHSRRRNPGVAGFSTNELIKLAGGAAVGVVGSKYLAQLALGSNNSGATGVAAGGFGASALALFQQYVGTGGNMSGLGDPDMAAFLGDFKPGMLPVPANWAGLAPVVAAGQSTGRRRG